MFVGGWTWDLYIAIITPGKIFLCLDFTRLPQTSLKFLGALPWPSEASTFLSVKSMHEIQLGVKG